MSSHQSLHQSQPPLRRCVICRETAPKPQLLRIVRRPDGEVALSDVDHGRGAYLHPDSGCLSVVTAQPKRLARALRQHPPDVILEQIGELAEVSSA